MLHIQQYYTEVLAATFFFDLDPIDLIPAISAVNKCSR
jgi:hypothetical protein